jgi:hypothetical protein
MDKNQSYLRYDLYRRARSTKLKIALTPLEWELAALVLGLFVGSTTFSGSWSGTVAVSSSCWWCSGIFKLLGGLIGAKTFLAVSRLVLLPPQ